MRDAREARADARFSRFDGGSAIDSRFMKGEHMSKYNSVNPGQYKVRGRERPGEDIPA
jgi:hypothetical protein